MIVVVTSPWVNQTNWNIWKEAHQCLHSNVLLKGNKVVKTVCKMSGLQCKHAKPIRCNQHSMGMWYKRKLK